MWIEVSWQWSVISVQLAVFSWQWLREPQPPRKPQPPRAFREPQFGPQGVLLELKGTK